MQIDLALIELGVMMLVLAVVGRLAGRLRLPTIPLFLLAGLAFGRGGVISVEHALSFVEVGASLGVIFLLFTLGLEYTPRELRQSLRTNARSGVIDIVLNATPGVVAGLVLGWGLLGATVLGGVTYISSSGIIAKLLTDMGRLGNRETPVVLSILVIEDVVMAVFLPVLAILLAGGSAVTGIVSGAVALAVIAVVLVFSPYAETHLNRLIGGRSDEVLLLTLLGLVTLVSGLAEYIHISYAIGAFFLGIVLSGQVAERARELLQPLRDSFAALFFVYFGLQVDSASLVNVLVPAMLLAAIGVITKLITGWWAAKLAGLAHGGARRAAVALIPRGEFSIVIAGIGVASGINDDLGLIVVAYVLISAVSGSLLTRFVR